MIDNHGVYICGDVNYPDRLIIIFSSNGELWSTQLDEVLDPEGFYDTLTVKGPFHQSGYKKPH